MNPQVSSVLHLIDEYKSACYRCYLNDNKLIDNELISNAAALYNRLIDSLNLLAGGSK